MKTKTRHVQILLDEEMYQLLRLMAFHKAKSVSSLIREAIKQTYKNKQRSIEDL